jgi:hypothetical protein
MSADDMNLPRMGNVRVVSGVSRVPSPFMDIFDPVQACIGKLDLKQLTQVLAVALKSQEKMVEIDMERLKIERETIGEFQKLIQGFGR